MFWKLISYDIDDGDVENGPGKSYEVSWAVCRAKDLKEADTILTAFIKATGISTSGECEIVEATVDEYEEYFEFLRETVEKEI